MIAVVPFPCSCCPMNRNGIDGFLLPAIADAARLYNPILNHISFLLTVPAGILNRACIPGVVSGYLPKRIDFMVSQNITGVVRAISLIFLFLFAACNADSRMRDAAKEPASPKGIFETVSSPQQVRDATLERMNELQVLPPASKEEYKLWLPRQIGEFDRKSFSAGNQALADISSLKSVFIHPAENKCIELNVIDGAGEAAGGFTMVYLGQFTRDFEQQDDFSYSKSVTRGGRRAIVSENTLENSAEIEYLEGERYYVKITGRNVGIEELWTVVEGLQTQALPGL